MAPTRKLGELFYELGVRTEGLKKDLDQTERAFGKLTTFVLKNPVVALAAIGTAVAGAAVKAVQAAATIDASMRKVASSVPQGTAGLKILRQELERISVATGKTQEELAQASEVIARTGAGSAEEVASRLRAAVDASQATGSSLEEIILGLDQTLDLFQISSAGASRALADLFTVARGRAPLDDVFQTLDKAAPSIQKLGLDLPTASRALIQLTESGLSTKKAAAAFTELANAGAAGKAEILKLAAAIPVAADPMKELAAAAQQVNDAATNAGPRIRAELNASLISLGTEILPLVNAGVGQLLFSLQRFRGGTTKDLQNAFAAVLIDGPKVFEAMNGKNPRQWDIAGGNIREVARAVVQLADAAAEGRVDLQQFGVEGLGRLADNVAKLSRLPWFAKQREDLLAFLQQITKAQAALVQLNAAPSGGKATPGAASVESEATRAARLEKQQQERETATRAIRDIEQSFTDLFARATAGNASIEDFDRSVRELGDAFRDKLKKPTVEQAALFTTLDARAKGVRETLAAITAKKAALEFDALRASLTPSIVDDFRVAMQQLREELERQRLSPEQIADLVALKQAQIDVALGAEDLESRIKNIIARSISAFDAQLGLMDALRGAEEELRKARTAPNALTDAGEIRIKGLLEQIEQLKAKIKELGGTTDGAISSTKAEAFATALSNAADFAVGLSTVLLGDDDTITRMITGVSQVASGFSKVAELAGKAGGFSSLFSSGAGIASALPGLGAIVGGIGVLASLRGQEDPASKALREALERNADRLEEFTSTVGDLVQISIGGSKIAGIRDLATQRDVQIGRDQQTDEPIFQTVSLNTTQLLAELRRAGVGLKDLQQIAQDFGVTFANLNAPTAGELQQLQAFIRENALKKLTDSLSGQLKLLELQARIDPDAFAGITGIIERIRVLSADKTGVPALRDALAGIPPLDAPGGPAAALEALKRLLADFTAGKIDFAQLGDLSPDAFVETIAALIESIRTAAPSLRTPATKFADALAAFGVAVELGSLDASQKLEKALALFTDLFPDLAGGVDTSSAEAFRTSIKSIIDGFAADGELTDAENAQIAVLRALIDAFDGAAPAAESLVDALSVLEDRFAIFGTSAAEQIAQLLAEVTGDASLGKTAAFALLKGLTDGLDLATAEGQSGLRERAKAIFEQLAVGGITEEEQAVIETLRRLLGLAVDVANDATKAAADAAAEQDRIAAERAQAQQSALDAAERRIRLNDVNDPAEQLRIRFAALAEVFPPLAAALAGIDVSTQDGRDALEAWIRAISESPDALASLADATGLTLDDLMRHLLDLEDGADAAQTAVASLADQLQTAFDAVDFDVALNNITDPVEKLQKAAKGIAGIIPEIDQALKGIDLSTASGRQQAEAALVALGKATADGATRQAILNLLDQIRGITANSASGDAGDAALSGARSGVSNVVSAASITEVTANRWLDIMTTDLVLSRERNATLMQILASVASAPQIRVPLLSGAGGGSPTIVNNIEIPVNFYGSVTTADATELAALLQRSIYAVITQQLAVQLQVSQRLSGKAAA